MNRSNFHRRLFSLILIAVCLPWITISSADAGCCINRVGDVNGEGGDEPSLSDVMYLVNYLFVDPTTVLPCLAEADINQSGGSSPVLDDITLADVMMLVDYLFISGSTAGLANCLDQSTDPYGFVFSMGRCKVLEGLPLTPDESGVTCIQYLYDGQGTLRLLHENAGLNCCPEPTLTVDVEGNTITITEVDEGLCDCYCLYDIQYQVKNLPPGEYRIVVNEAIYGGGEPLDFVVDLMQLPIGRVCVDRSSYPWSSEVTGIVTGHSGCKAYESTAASSPVSPDTSCISYSYDGLGVLTLHHENAAFNCCPDQLLADFDMVGNTITITEQEILDQGGCACLCLFDLDMQIFNLPPGQYHIVVVEPYRSVNDQPLDFVINLDGETSGSYCVERTEYPWGMMNVPSGSLISHSSCKSSTGNALADPIQSNQSCLVYTYDGSGTLSFVHVNAGFNCCPTEISAWFSFEDHLIRVHEVEDLSGGGCHCLCLFDLQFEVDNVPPGIYTIAVEEPYLSEGQNPLEVSLDLREIVTDTVCVERSVYPWGY